jgi:hypothetical protein
MKAILLTRTGDPSVLDYVDVPTPRPKAGEVLVKADTIGVSRPELHVSTARTDKRGSSCPQLSNVCSPGVFVKALALRSSLFRFGFLLRVSTFAPGRRIPQNRRRCGPCRRIFPNCTPIERTYSSIDFYESQADFPVPARIARIAKTSKKILYLVQQRVAVAEPFQHRTFHESFKFALSKHFRLLPVPLKYGALQFVHRERSIITG